MIRPILRWMGRRYQRRLGVEAPYFEELVEHAPGAFIPILGFVPATGYGRRLPADMLHVLRLGATRAQGCGSCLAIGVNLALGDGVPPDVVRAAAEGSGEGLAPELAVALRFGDRLARSLDVDEERARLQERFGTKGVIEASIAVAGALPFPAVQRGMGHSRACELDGPGPSLLSV